MDKSNIKITLLGDIFPGELAFTKNYGIKSQFTIQRNEFLCKKIKGIIGKNDLVIGNLESPLIGKNDIIKDIFYGDPNFAVILNNCGINLLTVANNHILEQGNAGFESTISILRKEGIDVVGIGDLNKSNIILKNIKGIKIAIAGFSNVDLHVIQKYDKFAILNEDNLISTINEMEEMHTDVKIVCFHWGNEYVPIPSLKQRMLARKLIDLGVNIIVGHHPHIIQPYEKYKNGHIFYSLGNFIFDYIHSKEFGIGMVIDVEITNTKNILTHLKGVKLSYKNVIENIPQETFLKYYNKINNKYKLLCSRPDTVYEIRYNSMVKKYRSLQRLLMKLHMVSEFFQINRKARYHLIKNVFFYYYKYLIRKTPR